MRKKFPGSLLCKTTSELFNEETQISKKLETVVYDLLWKGEHILLLQIP